MTELTTALRPDTQTERSPVPVATTVSEPTLITEQQVMFSTAAAVTAPAKTRGWGIESVAGAVRAWFAEAAKPPQPSFRKGHVYIENALMSREMDRL